MKLEPKESEKETVEAMEHERPMYPWGLCITLNNESLAILKKKYSDFEPEEEIMLKARLVVTSTSCHDMMGSEKQESVSLQITEMELSQEGYIEKRANKIYKKK